MQKIKKEETEYEKWDGIIFGKHLEMDVFKESLHGIHDGEIRYICYWKQSKLNKKIKKYLQCLPIYFIINLIFGSMGFALFTYFKYKYMFISLLHCSKYIVYDEIKIDKKLFNIDKIKRLLILDILQNDCQELIEQEIIKIPNIIYQLCTEFTPDCIIPNRIQYKQKSMYYSTTYYI